MDRDFNEVIRVIRENDSRYAKGAYYFVRQGLDHTLRKLQKSRSLATNRHVSGRQLGDGMREYALEQYGPLSRTVLNHWGIRESADFGAIVFNLVEFKVLGKTQDDRAEDFNDLFDFEDAFEGPFRPRTEHAHNRIAELVLQPEGETPGELDWN